MYNNYHRKQIQKEIYHSLIPLQFSARAHCSISRCLFPAFIFLFRFHAFSLPLFYKPFSTSSLPFPFVFSPPPFGINSLATNFFFSVVAYGNLLGTTNVEYFLDIRPHVGFDLTIVGREANETKGQSIWSGPFIWVNLSLCFEKIL